MFNFFALLLGQNPCIQWEKQGGGDSKTVSAALDNTKLPASAGIRTPARPTGSQS